MLALAMERVSTHEFALVRARIRGERFDRAGAMSVVHRGSLFQLLMIGRKSQWFLAVQQLCAMIHCRGDC